MFSSADPELPFKQGDLDWLCSIYAILNVAKLEGRLLDETVASQHFSGAINAIALEGCLPRAICEGIKPRDIQWLWKKCGMDKRVQRVGRLESAESIDRISRALVNGAKGVLVFLQWPTCKKKVALYSNQEHKRIVSEAIR